MVSASVASSPSYSQHLVQQKWSGLIGTGLRDNSRVGYAPVYLCEDILFAGTPPRIDKSTISFDPLWEQLGDDPPTPFSFMNEAKGLEVYIVLYHFLWLSLMCRHSKSVAT